MGRWECEEIEEAEEKSDISADRRVGFNKIREDRRDGSSEIRENREDGFIQKSKRKTCERLGKTDETTKANWSNNFDVLKLTGT